MIEIRIEIFFDSTCKMEIRLEIVEDLFCHSIKSVWEPIKYSDFKRNKSIIIQSKLIHFLVESNRSQFSSITFQE